MVAWEVPVIRLLCCLEGVKPGRDFQGKRNYSGYVFQCVSFFFHVFQCFSLFFCISLNLGACGVLHALMKLEHFGAKVTKSRLFCRDLQFQPESLRAAHRFSEIVFAMFRYCEWLLQDTSSGPFQYHLGASHSGDAAIPYAIFATGLATFLVVLLDLLTMDL